MGPVTMAYTVVNVRTHTQEVLIAPSAPWLVFTQAKIKNKMLKSMKGLLRGTWYLTGSSYRNSKM